jgi:hypothetical protein
MRHESYGRRTTDVAVCVASLSYYRPTLNSVDTDSVVKQRQFILLDAMIYIVDIAIKKN